MIHSHPVKHHKTCSCNECIIDRLNAKIKELEAEVKALEISTIHAKWKSAMDTIEQLEADFDKGYEAGRDDMESEKDTVIEQLQADIKGLRTLVDDELLELYYQDEQPPPKDAT